MKNYIKNNFIVGLVLILCIKSLFLLASENFTVLEEKATIPLLTPSLAERHTEKIQLANGLQAYLISDAQLDKSSAAMVVKVGSWDNPVDHPGMAHFCEHMLFLGTKKYPNESEFDSFIAENGGLANAFTANHCTSYLFSIDHAGYLEALDRFSSFFIEPLFNPSGVARELQAIDQEYAKNLENDALRVHYVLKELTDATHPHHGFSMGNRASLQHVAREELIEWYNSHYSAHKMVLVLSSNLPLEKLRQLAVNHFGAVPVRPVPPTSVSTPLLNAQTKGSKVYIEPIKNSRYLVLTWDLPPRIAAMRHAKPEKIVCHLLGHQGEKSLLAQLKKEKLAISLQADASLIGGENRQLQLAIELTDFGVKNVDQVILKLFQAIAECKQKGVPRYLFDELRQMDLINYQYQPKNSSFDEIFAHALALGDEALETYPEQTHLIEHFDPQAVAQLLDELVPAQAVYCLLAPEKLTGVPLDRQEAWLKVDYAIKPIPQEQLQQWQAADSHPEINLPDPNPYIPKKLNLISVEKPGDEVTILPVPYPILDNEGGLVYYAQDDRYRVPQVACYFEIKMPVITPEKPESLVLADLYLDAVREHLNACTYPAMLAGLSFEISRSDNGITIAVNGYSDKAEALFIDLITKIREFHPEESTFKQFKEPLMKVYEDLLLGTPVHQALEVLSTTLHQDYVSMQTRASLLSEISFDQFESFVHSLYKEAYIKGVIYGNLAETSARALVSRMQSTLSVQPYLKQDQFSRKVMLLPQEKGPYYYELQSKVQGNGVILVIQEEENSFKTKAAQQILMQGMRPAFFSTLRTKQQTGYIVSCSAEDIDKQLFNTFLVQSNTHDGRDLLSRFELFIEDFLQEMERETLTEERFNAIRSALINTLMEPPKAQSEMLTLLHTLLFKHHGDLQRIEKRVKGFQELTYPEFVQMAKKVMSKQNSRRLAVLVSGVIPAEESLQYKKLQNLNQIRAVAEFKGEEPAVGKNGG